LCGELFRMTAKIDLVHVPYKGGSQAITDILGGQTFAMRLWLDPAQMASRGISAADVALAIRANNYQSAPGQAKGFFTITNISARTGLADVDQFKRMVVKSAGGAVVRLEDIAKVDLGAQSWTSSVAMNGQQAVFIGVQATPTGNPLTLVAGVRALLPEIERNLPPAVKMQVAYDSTRFIQASIDEVEWSLGQAVLIVVAVIFLFLGSFRSVLIPIVTIPLSLIGAGIIMTALGFSLNLLTLLAMVLAIGLVVDDAIVVLENVYRHIEEGKSAAQAALSGEPVSAPEPSIRSPSPSPCAISRCPFFRTPSPSMPPASRPPSISLLLSMALSAIISPGTGCSGPPP